MTIPAWPTTLPSEFLQRGFSQTAPDVSLRTSMDAGPSKIRRRFTANVSPVQGNLILTPAQVNTLWDFFNNDLNGGTLRFSWREPVTLAAKEFRFTEPPKRTIDKGLYHVDLSLELLP